MFDIEEGLLWEKNCVEDIRPAPVWRQASRLRYCIAQENIVNG